MGAGGAKRYPGMDFAIRFTDGEAFTIGGTAAEFHVSKRTVYRWVALMEAYFPVEWIRLPGEGTRVRRMKL